MQANNKRGNRVITYRGKTQTQKQWADELGINYGTLENRLYIYGWDVDKSFNEPIKEPIKLSYNKETHTLSEWAEITGINYDCLWSRYNLGWSTHDILTTPKKERCANE